MRQDELNARVDALLARPRDLPEPAERERLRKAAKVTQAEAAEVFDVRRETFRTWETGRNEPRPPGLQAYMRLLAGWAAEYPPAPGSTAASVVPDTHAAMPHEPDRTADGVLVTGAWLACRLCGGATPHRAGGEPQHVGGFCQSRAAASVARTDEIPPAGAPAADEDEAMTNNAGGTGGSDRYRPGNGDAMRVQRNATPGQAIPAEPDRNEQGVLVYRSIDENDSAERCISTNVRLDQAG